jgi:hypothetical protein
MIKREKCFKNTLGLILLLYSLMNTSPGKLICQQKEGCLFKRNILYADFSTQGAYYSINYERNFLQKKINLCGQIGLSILKGAIAFPAGVNLFTSKSNSHAEFGFIFMPYIAEYKSFMSQNDLSDKFLYLIPRIGYRYQKPVGGLFFRAAISPTIILDPPSNDFWNMDPKLCFSANLSLGFSF